MNSPTHMLHLSIPLTAADDAAARVLAQEILSKLGLPEPVAGGEFKPLDPKLDVLCPDGTLPWWPPKRLPWKEQA